MSDELKPLQTLGPDGPVLMSSLEDNGVISSDKEFIVLIDSAATGIFNDMEHKIFSIDDDFIDENVKYTITSYQNKNADVSQIFIDILQECFDMGENNGLPITSDLIKACVFHGKIVKPEIAQLFGIFLGVYIGIRSGYTRFYIPIIDKHLHPSRQRLIVPLLKTFSDRILSLMKQAQEKQK